MQSIAWWTSLVVLSVASGIDIYCRRIPNWLVLPFLAAGTVAQFLTGGWAGLGRSLAGISLGVLLFGLPCLVGGMGMGDLKLAAAVGGWVGPSQLFMTFIFCGIFGGMLAVVYAVWHRSLTESLDRAAGLLADFGALRLPSHDPGKLAVSQGRAIPYAPVIAVGALLSFFAL